MRLPFRRRVEPVPPDNVRVVLANGDVVPAELVYAGRDRGLDRWVAAYPIHLGAGPLPVDVLCDNLPGRSSIELWFYRNDGPDE